MAVNVQRVVDVTEAMIPVAVLAHILHKQKKLLLEKKKEGKTRWL